MRSRRWPGRSRRWASSCAPRSRPGGPTCRLEQNVLRAFTQPFAGVRVLIVGQDPYPTPGHPVGLSFSGATRRPAVAAQPAEHLPRAEHRSRPARPRTGDLSPWAAHGVLLLNRVLTVTPGRPGVPSGKGLGGGNRSGDPRSRGARHTVGRDPVGTGRADATTPAGRRAPDRVGAPQSDVGRSRLFRLTAVQPEQCAARERGGGCRGLAPDLTRAPSAERYADSVAGPTRHAYRCAKGRGNGDVGANRYAQ